MWTSIAAMSATRLPNSLLQLKRFSPKGAWGARRLLHVDRPWSSPFTCSLSYSLTHILVDLSIRCLQFQSFVCAFFLVNLLLQRFIAHGRAACRIFTRAVATTEAPR